MRCKCCDAPGALAYDPPDYYCGTCIEIIFKTIGKEYSLQDVYETLCPDEDDIGALIK